MAMTNAGLSAKIKTELENMFGTSSDPVWLQKFSDAIGKAVVEYVQLNAEIDLQHGDIEVLAGGLTWNVVNPVYGSTVTEAATLTQRIQ